MPGGQQKVVKYNQPYKELHDKLKVKSDPDNYRDQKLCVVLKKLTFFYPLRLNTKLRSIVRTAKVDFA